MTTAALRAGEFVMQVDEHGTGEMTDRVLASALIVIGKMESHVAGNWSVDLVGSGEECEQLGGGDQRHESTVVAGTGQGRRTLVGDSRTRRRCSHDRCSQDRCTMTDAPCHDPERDEPSGGPIDEPRADEDRVIESEAVADLLPDELHLPLEAAEADAVEQAREVAFEEESR